MSERLERLRTYLAGRDLDGVLITDAVHRHYFSGYSAEDHDLAVPQGALLVSQDVAILLTSPNNTEWAEAEAPEFEVIGWGRPWVGSIVERIKSLGWRRVGFEDRAMSVAAHAALSSALSDDVTLVPLGDALASPRTIKTADDLAAIERALALTDIGFEAAQRHLRVGITEQQLAWEAERAMREAGADGVAFPVTVASGPHAARPHHRVTDRPITAGEPIVIDLGARINGFNGDLTRTIWLGEPDERLRSVYNLVLEAQEAALAVLRDGLPARDADRAARAVIQAAGFGDAFVHGLGHGLGMRVHEAPSLSPASNEILAAGMVTTVEPGIYLPGWGGVRIEDVAVIEPSGCRVLTRAPKLPRGE